jgi:hypothetical protein
MTIRREKPNLVKIGQKYRTLHIKPSVRCIVAGDMQQQCKTNTSLRFRSNVFNIDKNSDTAYLVYEDTVRTPQKTPHAHSVLLRYDLHLYP